MALPEKLQFTDALGNTIDFLSSSFRVINHLGFEGPVPQHRVIESPVRDGSRYLNTRYRELFPLIQFEIDGASYQNLMVRRRQIIPILAPKRGLGVLQYQAASGGSEYHIDALVERRNYSGAPLPRMAFEQWTVQFRCPNPFWRSAAATVTVISQAGGGMSVPTSIPMSISGQDGLNAVVNEGDVESYPIVTLVPEVGGVVSPSIANTTTGETLILSGLTVPHGSTLTIDMLNRTAKVDGQSVLSYLTAASVFWGLEAGNNTIEAAQTSGDGTWNVSHYSYYEGI